MRAGRFSVDDARHFFPFLPVAFALGIATYFVWPSEPGLHYLAALPVLLAVGRVPSLRAPAGIYELYVKSAMIFCMCLICGAGWAHLHSYRASQNWATPLLPAGGVETTIAGQVDMSEIRWRGGELHITVCESSFTDNAAEVPSGILPRPFRARLFSSKEIAFRARPGCHARLKVRLQPLGAPLTDGGYDPRFPAFFEGLRARGFVREIVSLTCETGTWAHRLARLRLDMADQIRTTLPPQTGGVAAALIAGLRGGISPAIRDTSRNSGLAHILAISGLHMALFAGTVFALLRVLCALFPRFAQAHDVRRISACVALAAAVAYLALSGASYATQRAFVMIALVFIAIGRQALTMRNVGWAGLCVLLINPHAVMQVGFQMSFAAVIILVGFFEAWRRHSARHGQVFRKGAFWRGVSRARVYVFGLLLTSLLAGGVTGVLALIHFNQMAKFGLIGNLIAMPIFGMMVMPAAFVSVVAMPFGLAAGPLWVMGTGLNWILLGAGQLVETGDPLFRVGASPVYVLPAFMIGLIWLCLVGGRARWCGLAAMMFALLSLGRQPVPDVHILGEAYQLAWRTPSGDMAVMHEKRAGYETDIWRRRLGWPAQVSDAGYAACRFPACRIDLRAGAQLALVTDARHLSAACGSVDVVIAPYIRARYPCAAHLVDRRALKPFATTLVYIDPTASGLRVFTRMPRANTARVWQRRAPNTVRR